MKILKFILFLVIGISSYAQNNRELILETIDGKLKAKYGNEVNALNFVNIDDAAIKSLNYPIPDKVVDYHNVLSGMFAFTAFKNDSTGPTKGLFGLFKDGNIIWDSDTTINCIDVDALYLNSTFDINNDGKIEIIYQTEEWGIQVGTNRLYIYSWDGNSGQLISKLDSIGISEIASLTNIGNFDFVDVNGDGIYEITGLWYLSDEDKDETIVTYYWNGINYSFDPTRFQPRPIDFFPQNKIDVEIKASVIRIDSVFRYNYMITNNPNSIQEINGIYFKKLIKSINVENYPYGWEYYEFFDLLAFQDFNSPTIKYKNYHIRIGESDSSIKLSSFGLPSIVSLYAQGYNQEPLDSTLTMDDYYNNILINSFNRFTLGPKEIDSPFVPINFIDTLITYSTKSSELGWITNQSTANKYDSLFTLAKTQLQQNNNNAARTTLQTVLQEVDIDSTDNLTSEAYALIKYNTEYLLSKLSEQSVLDISLINPAMSLVNPGAFTMEIKGIRFTANSIVYFNGSARATTFISDSVLNAQILSTDVSAAGNYPVWVSDGTTNSDTLIYKVVSTLPQPVRPVLECVRNNGDGTYTAFFGYKNDNSVSVYIPVGGKNKFTPTPQDRGQPRVFEPGRHYKVFTVNFSGSNLVWTLNGRTSTASSNSAPCN